MIEKVRITKKYIIGLIAISLLISLNCFANIKKITTLSFSIVLPSQIHKVMKDESNPLLYRYLFRTLPNSKYSQQQIYVSVLSQVPKNVSDYTSWEAKIIGKMSEDFANYYLGLKDQPNVIKTDAVVLGSQKFLIVSRKFKNIQAKFLITIYKNTTYTFTLISINPNTGKRNKNMNMLLDSVRTIKYFGINLNKNTSESHPHHHWKD